MRDYHFFFNERQEIISMSIITNADKITSPEMSYNPYYVKSLIVSGNNESQAKEQAMHRVKSILDTLNQ